MECQKHRSESLLLSSGEFSICCFRDCILELLETTVELPPDSADLVTKFCEEVHIRPEMVALCEICLCRFWSPQKLWLLKMFMQLGERPSVHCFSVATRFHLNGGFEHEETPSADWRSCMIRFSLGCRALRTVNLLVRYHGNRSEAMSIISLQVKTLIG